MCYEEQSDGNTSMLKDDMELHWDAPSRPYMHEAKENVPDEIEEWITGQRSPFFDSTPLPRGPFLCSGPALVCRRVTLVLLMRSASRGIPLLNLVRSVVGVASQFMSSSCTPRKYSLELT